MSTAEFKTYHCLFMLGEEKLIAKVKTDKDLPLDVVRFATLILVDPAPEQFMKDRFDLAGKYSECATVAEVVAWIDTALRRVRC